ncbi:MAG: hypothetical protein P4L28_12005 [Paludibacteraceae bacterium]|nr:hypothetical protein [Paludibacteraceae bacterium]
MNTHALQSSLQKTNNNIHRASTPTHHTNAPHLPLESNPFVPKILQADKPPSV